MKHNSKQMRLNYDKERDQFTLELLIDGEWCYSIGCTCRRREGAKKEEEACFIHYDMLKHINHNLALGYTLICNYHF